MVPVSTNIEPHSLAGHVKRREGQRIVALPPPASKSSAPLGVLKRHGGGGTEDDEGDDAGGEGGNEDGEGNEDNDSDGTGVEVQEGSSDDEFESATSTPWPEGVGMSDPGGDAYVLKPTPDSVIDAATTELKRLQQAARRAEVELHIIKRKARDLDGPGWILFAWDARALGIEVYQLYSEGGRVWRYKAHDTGRGEMVSEPHEPEYRIEISIEELNAVGWFWERESQEWKRQPTPQEESASPFAPTLFIQRLPPALQRYPYDEQETRPSEALTLDPRNLGQRP